MGAHRLIPLFFFDSPDSRLRSLLVVWKKSLALDYGVPCPSCGSCVSATLRLSIPSGFGVCESPLQIAVSDAVSRLSLLGSVFVIGSANLSASSPVLLTGSTGIIVSHAV